ncbi:LuxR family transcriptional regulator [Pseudarthrobacter polychromogenes]|uniref:LuxR family transcriptional regulator n=1 Tax=Pseudarthrobacter polychromogenes TaxID=1676 RepID=A0ABQ1XX89_9MICC|nr:LuxR family transcriptional regulator [Pseudarthrobacter polychromogenes]GGH06095.1 LuxR family transcriptional regulator [Pseudarthrobacter polychromogenes]
MQEMSIEALARQQIAAAVVAPSGRAADTAFGGHEKKLRQTVMAFRAGTELSEHQSPGEAGDLLIVPDGLHSLEAEEDSTALFTVGQDRPLKIARQTSQLQSLSRLVDWP